MPTTLETRNSANHAYSGKAIIAFAIGLVAVFLPAPFNIVLAAVGLVAALLSRRDLRSDPQLRGTLLSLLTFLLCGCVLVFGVLGVGLAL